MKRNAASYSTTVVEEEKLEEDDNEAKSNATLKLKRPKQTLSASKRLAFELSQYSTQQEILTILVDIERELPLETLEEVEFAIQTLWERLYESEDVVVKAKIISLLGSLARFPGVNINPIVDSLLKILNSEASHKVVGQIFQTLLVLGRLFSSETKLAHQIQHLAIQYLKDSHHSVRCQCLKLIGHLSSADGSVGGAGGSKTGVQSILVGLATDSDPRVRTSALQALLTLHERGHTLEAAMYDHACRALEDDYEEVRLAAIKLVWVFSHISPERIVKLPSSDEFRLVDDAFVKICHMVNDLSMKVRAEAVGLLGSLHQVSPKFLEQTLDKKLMSHLRRKKTEHEKSRERHAAGGSANWSTGRAWGDGPGKAALDPGDVSIISSGACGAFVHGLEDEFLEVRSAAVDSMCELANQHAPFAVMSLDFLADMLNDEIESVRLNAINSLRKIAHHICLREDQLETVLSALEDFSGSVREAVREVLCHSVLSTRACLHAAIHALLGNLAKYPQDRASIWRCAKFLGEKHEHLASSLVPELLSTHPFFATPEPSVADPAYVAIVILVFNAAVKSPTMLAMFPEHTRRHYSLLRDSQPALVPRLQVDTTSALFDEIKPDKDSTNTRRFLENVQERIRPTCNMEADAAIEVMKSAIQDVQHISGIDPQLAANAECLSSYLQCQLLILRAQTDRLWSTPAALCTGRGSGMKSLVEKLVTLSYRAEHTFLGLSVEQVSLLRQLRLIAHALKILAAQRAEVSTDRTLNTTLLEWEPLLLRIKAFSKFSANQGAVSDPFLERLLSFPEFFEAHITQPRHVAEFLLSAVLKRRVPCLELCSHVRRASAVMIEPDGRSDNPLCFAAGLTLGINVEAVLENVTEPANVRVQVLFPDMRRQLFTPKLEDFHHLSPLRQRLLTTIVLSHPAWTEPGHVEVSLVVQYTPDVSESGLVASERSRPGDAKPKTAKQTKSCTDSIVAGVVGLCAPVTLSIMPKQGFR